MKRSAFITPQRLLAGTFALVALFAFATPQTADASTAANSRISNVVTVDYNDAANNPQTPVTTNVNVTVNLVAATPTLVNTSGATQTINAAGTAVYNYTIASNANGPDTYNLAEASLAESAGITGSTSAFSAASVTLGGTTLAADTNGTAIITVPYDGTNDSIVNGIAVGEKIVINGTVYTVAPAGITETPATNLATITLTVVVPAVVNSTGNIVGEQQTFTLTVTPGTVSANSDQTITVNINAQDALAAAAATANDETITTVQTANIQVIKEVSTDGGANFLATANANPASTLTYRITITNTGSAVANSVVLTDPAPQFTTYVGSSAKSSVTLADTYGSGTNTDLTDLNAADDGYDYGVTTADQATFSAGNIAAGSSVLLFFQVTID